MSPPPGDTSMDQTLSNNHSQLERAMLCKTSDWPMPSHKDCAKHCVATLVSLRELQAPLHVAEVEVRSRNVTVIQDLPLCRADSA